MKITFNDVTPEQAIMLEQTMLGAYGESSTECEYKSKREEWMHRNYDAIEELHLSFMAETGERVTLGEFASAIFKETVHA